MSDRDPVRAFLAVPPDPAWVEAARGLLSRCRHRLPDAAWTRPESWHLTLRFLGEVSRERLSAFASAIGRAAARLAGVDLATRGAVVFPPRGAARVLGIGFEAPEGGALSSLAREAERAAAEAGLEPERRVFHPHVTLARLRRPWPAEKITGFREEVGGWALPLWPVRSCVLYESLLTSGGPIHTPAERWSLAPPQAILA